MSVIHVYILFTSSWYSGFFHLALYQSEQMKINVPRLPTAKCHEYKEGQPLKNFNLETFSFALNPQRVINHVSHY